MNALESYEMSVVFMVHPRQRQGKEKRSQNYLNWLGQPCLVLAECCPARSELAAHVSRTSGEQKEKERERERAEGDCARSEGIERDNEEERERESQRKICI